MRPQIIQAFRDLFFVTSQKICGWRIFLNHKSVVYTKRCVQEFGRPILIPVKWKGKEYFEEENTDGFNIGVG